MRNPEQLTKSDIEALRGELFHMILFSLAWALIGEYVLNFTDYAAGAGLILIIVVGLALYTIKLYKVEDELEEYAGFEDRTVLRKDRLYAIIFVFESVAIFITWALIFKLGHENWLICCFAGIAGLHFFPLARVIRQNSYYWLGVWLCALSVGGLLLLISGKMPEDEVDWIVAYGCAAGGAFDGIWIMWKTRRTLMP